MDRTAKWDFLIDFERFFIKNLKFKPIIYIRIQFLPKERKRMIGSIGGRLPVEGAVMPVRSVIGSGESTRESTTSKERSYELSEKDATALLERAVAFANSHLKTSKQYLKFEYHDQLNKYYVKVVNEETEEVVREIPPKKLLDMFAAMANVMGILVDKKI